MDVNESTIVARIMKLYRKYGFKLFLCFFMMAILIVILFVTLLSFLWRYKKAHVEPIGSYVSTLKYDKEISVIKEQSLMGKNSVEGMIEEVFSGINDTTQAISLAKSLSEAYTASKTEKAKLLIPKGAGVTELKDDSGYTELGSFSIYLWKEKGTYVLFGRDYTELHAVMIYDDKYIHAYVHTQVCSLNVVTEVGKLQELQK